MVRYIMRDSISPFLAGVNALDSDPSRTSSPSNRSAQFLFSRGELLPLTVPSGAGRLYVPSATTTEGSGARRLREEWRFKVRFFR